MLYMADWLLLTTAPTLQSEFTTAQKNSIKIALILVQQNSGQESVLSNYLEVQQEQC